MKLGIIARADLTGLGVQSRNWVRLLNPAKTIVINSTSFNNNEQHLEWYDGRGGYIVNGFIKPNEIIPILNGLDAIMTFEIPYNYELFNVARKRGVKTILQNNWEFTDYLRNSDLPLPDLLLNHSYWHLDEQITRWPQISGYLPTPVFLEDYDVIRQQNHNRTGKVRFLHVAGRKTYEDRNGTEALIQAVNMISKDIDFELVIKTQNVAVITDDPRIVIDNSQPIDEKELYRDFDALIMPRRYGGACLPMTEALASGLPVIMPKIEPNDIVLPNQWLFQVGQGKILQTRTEIQTADIKPDILADKIVEFVQMKPDQLLKQKELAYIIAEREYGSKAVLEKFSLQLAKIGL